MVELLGTERALARNPELVRLAGRRSVPVSTVTERGMAGLSETASPQGLVAVCRFLDIGLAELVAGGPRLVVLLAAIRDPGNAGTVLRTAEAVGAGAVVFSTASVDPYNGKCVRASAGSLFHLPVARSVDPAEAVAALAAAGFAVLAATATGEVRLADIGRSVTPGRPVAWMFGNEAGGLPDELAAAADARVRIPIVGRAESLNLAAAAAICLYETAQARHGG